MYYASGFLSLLGFAAAAWFSVLLARADREFRKGTPDAVTRAVALTPSNTAYLSRQALQIEYDGGDARPILERMAALTPTASAPRIRLGLNAEIRGDLDAAQRWLLDAARVDRQFEPAWTLANFYYRQQNAPEFWTWMRTALQVSYGDRTPAFELCWNQTSNGQEILSRAIPPRREVVAAYLIYLLQTRRLIEAVPVSLNLAAFRDPVDLALLYSASDAFLDNGQGSAALQLWNALGLSTNVDAPPTGHGFDWRQIPSEGISYIAIDTPPARRIVFNGRQPESCDLLHRFLNLTAGRSYILRWEARTSGFPMQTGLEWRVASQTVPLSAQEDWHAGELSFHATLDFPVLSLSYHRPSGEPRAEGYVEIRQVTLMEALR